MFKPNPALKAELMKAPAYRDALTAAAEAGKSHAESVSPAGRDYADRFVVVADADGVKLGNLDPFAHLVEWGSRNNPAYAPLRRGVRAAGLRLSEDSN